MQGSFLVRGVHSCHLVLGILSCDSPTTQQFQPCQFPIAGLPPLPGPLHGTLLQPSPGRPRKHAHCRTSEGFDITSGWKCLQLLLPCVPSSLFLPKKLLPVVCFSGRRATDSSCPGIPLPLGLWLHQLATPCLPPCPFQPQR